MMVSGIIVSPDGDFNHTYLHELSDYQDAVGGYFEVIPLPLPDPDNEARTLPHTMYINDSSQIGAVDVVQYNKVASAMAYVGGRYITVLGSVVIVGPPTEDGEDTDANTGAIVKWISRIRRVNN